MSDNKSIVIRISGDSGDGVQLVGEQLTITAALSGKDVRTLPDFPAEIRAPTGTPAGVSGFQLAMSEGSLFTAGETLDVLVALNPAALKTSISYLVPGGLLILNEDSLKPREWEKAGLPEGYLGEIKDNYQIITLPLITNTLAAVKEFDLNNTQAKKTKNFYTLGIVLWLFDLNPDTPIKFIEKKFKDKENIKEANIAALKAGFYYAETIELSRQEFIIGKTQREKGSYRQITGIEASALAMATVATGTKTSMLVAGYPITPASSILQHAAKLKSYGIELLQAEDEIAAICACVGASFGGKLALTCTSGPGFDLKTEGLGLAVITELPLVVVDVQRAGASTGMPTKTGQSDLNQALFGRHGEAPIPIIAALSPSDCFKTIIEAFNFAVKYMTPVIVLMDAYLANAAEPWRIPEVSDIELPELKFNRFAKPYMRDENLVRSWNIPGSEGFIHQLGGLEKQGEEGKVSYDAQNHSDMVKLREQKIENIAKEYPETVFEGDKDNNDILLIGWGSTYGSLKAAQAKCAELNLNVSLLQLRYLNPLPLDLEDKIKRFKHVVVAELNSGHLCNFIRSKYLVDAKSISLCTGLPFTTKFLVNSILKIADR